MSDADLIDKEESGDEDLIKEKFMINDRLIVAMKRKEN